MQARLTTKPEQEVIAAIQALDLESVKLRVTDAEGWSREYADSVEVAYKTYLAMVVKYQEHAEDILLSKEVDEFWHAHILHTMKYTEDCERVFGKYLHHNPQVGKQAPADMGRKAALTEKAWRLYQREFEAANAAMCNAAIRAGDAAMCNAAVHAESAAMCNAAIRPGEAAMCNAAVHAENAAMCNAAIRAGDAAMCNAAVHAENAAMCNAAIRAGDAAMCNAAVRANHSPRAHSAVA